MLFVALPIRRLVGLILVPSSHLELSFGGGRTSAEQTGGAERAGETTGCLSMERRTAEGAEAEEQLQHRRPTRKHSGDGEATARSGGLMSLMGGDESILSLLATEVQIVTCSEDVVESANRQLLTA